MSDRVGVLGGLRQDRSATAHLDGQAYGQGRDEKQFVKP